MKKTIITLLALAGVAAATEQTITLSDYGYTDGFYATSVLDLEDLASIITTKNLDTTLIGVGVAIDNNTTHSGVLTVKSWTNNELHVYHNQAAGVSSSGFGNAGASFSAPDGYTWPQGHAINNAFEKFLSQQSVFKLCYALHCHRGDEVGGDTLGECGLQVVDNLLIHHITLGDGK